MAQTEKKLRPSKKTTMGIPTNFYLPYLYICIYRCSLCV